MAFFMGSRQQNLGLPVRRPRESRGWSRPCRRGDGGSGELVGWQGVHAGQLDMIGFGVLSIERDGGGGGGGGVEALGEGGADGGEGADRLVGDGWLVVDADVDGGVEVEQGV